MNMLFGKKDKQPQEPADASAASAKQDPRSSTNSQANTGAETATNAFKLQDVASHTDIMYPSGLKLALLLISIFVSMFLVSLVC